MSAAPLRLGRKAAPVLSSGQTEARGAVLDALRQGARTASLVGPAGTGKTWLMRVLLDDIEQDLQRRVVLAAPTGKAAARLKEATGREASTLHRLLYSKVREVGGKPLFSDPRAVAFPGDVVIVDECSMVGKMLYDDVLSTLPSSCSILFVGDREQLPPVNDEWGVDFSSPTGLLSEVLRQAEGSPIVRAATALREGLPWEQLDFGAVGCRRVQGTAEDAGEWLAEQRDRGIDATLITYSNATRREANGFVHANRLRDDEALLCPGDTIVCTQNDRSLGILNGETRCVSQVLPYGEIRGHKRLAACWAGGGAMLLPEFLAAGVPSDVWADLSANGTRRPGVLKAEYGECLTVHRAQGSQWRRVGIIVDGAMYGLRDRDPESFRRLMYTALTRASEEVVIFDDLQEYKTTMESPVPGGLQGQLISRFAGRCDGL